MSLFPYKAEEYHREIFKPIPENLYKVKITKCKEIENFAHTAKGIGVTYSVTDGQYKGRIIFDNFYIEHENKVFENRGKNKFNGLLQAIEMENIDYLFQLNSRDLIIKVKIQKASADGKFPEKNIVVDYYSVNENFQQDENYTSPTLPIIDDDVPF